MRPPRAWLVHGFNVRDAGRRTIDRLQSLLEERGWEVEDYDYGWTGLLGVRFGNASRSRTLAERTVPGDIAFGHSNGCAIIHAAAWAGAPFGRVVYINPALDRDAPLAPIPRRLYVWHSPSDRAVRLSKLFYRHEWGDMGAKGYCGPFDRRIRNYNMEHGSFPVKASGHSAVFRDPQWKFFGPMIADCGGQWTTPIPEANSPQFLMHGYESDEQGNSPDLVVTTRPDR
jgi:hypothetical protein